MQKLINWFIPEGKIRGRTNIEMARVFVFTHLFGPIIATPMAVYLYIVSPPHHYAMYSMLVMIGSFLLLPMLLRATGNMTMVALMSFQGLATASLFGTYHYGGFSSPFLPWLVVSLLLGFFYLSKRIKLVITMFALNIAVFILLSLKGFPTIVPVAKLEILGWLSIVAAAVYMSWMALYYARMIAMRTELAEEADRYRHTMAELSKARAHAVEVSNNRAKFFSKMSHELRTPLNAIIGYSEIMLEDCEQDKIGNETLHTDLKRINAAGKHLLSLVSDVLDTDKIESAALEITPTRFRLEEVCEEVVASARPMVERNNNRLEIHCGNPREIVQTDRRRLRQIIINLLSNAGKFTENGTVKLTFRMDTGVVDERLVVSVADTGIGISQEGQAKLFEDFVQADETISNRFGGTGIGLAISRKFAILLGGNITVKSTPGAGAEFTVDIPAKLEIDEQKSRPVEPRLQQRSAA